MIEILAGIAASFLTGVFGHLAFFPVIENWHNQRLRQLARPAIGVLLNTMPFLIWLRVLSHKDVEERELWRGLMAYSVSFLWNGAGVAFGYILDDWRENGGGKHDQTF